MFIFLIFTENIDEKKPMYFFYSFTLFIGIPFIYMGLTAINTMPLKKTTFFVKDSVLSIEISRFLSSIFIIITAGLIVFFYHILYKFYNSHKRISELEKKAISRQRLEELGKLTAGIAHEINNSLSSIGGFSELLLEKEDRDENKKFLKIICDECEQLKNRLSEILSFSRQGNETEIIDIQENIKNTVEFLKSNIKFKEIVFDLDKLNPGKIVINPGEFKQVLLNLFINSADSMEYSGKISISGRDKDGMYIMFFKDIGKGINDDIKKRIFEPFFSKKSDGTGLGLFITRQIVLKYDGNIELDDSEDGCCFRIEFPSYREI